MAKKRTRRGNGSRAIRDATGSKPAERDLRGLEEEWRSLAENIPDIIATVDADGTILFVNRTISGQAVDTVVGARVYDYLPPEHHHTLRQSLKRVFDRGQAHSFEVAGAGPFGRTSWYLNRVGPIVRDGNVVAAALITTDITERKRTEVALRDSEARFRSTLDSMIEGALIVGFDWRYLYANDAVARHTSRSKEELLGHTMMEMHPGIENTPEFAHVRRSMEERVAHQMEWRYAYPDGSTAWFDVSIQPVPEGVFMLFLNVTERKRAEEELRTSEERYRDLAENLNDAVFEFDTSGRITFASSGMEEVTGYSAAEVIGRSFIELVHPDDLEAVTDKVRQRPFGDRKPNEYRLVAKSGEARWVRSLGGPVFDGSRVIAFRAALTDITEHRRAQQALHDSEAKWRSLVMDSPDVIMTVGPDGMIQFINHVVSEVSGETEVIGTSVYRYVTPEYHHTVRDSIERVFRTGNPDTHQTIVAGRRGHTWYETRVGPIKQRGRVVAVTMAARDITEGKLAEEALRESEEKYRRLVQDSTDGIVVAEGPQMRFVNSALLRMFGCRSETEMIGRPFTDFVSPEYRQGLLERNRAREQGQDVPAQYEFKALRKDGGTFDVDVSIGRVVYQGKVVTQAIVRDISERKQAEEALHESENRYRELVEDINDIIYEVDASGRITYVSPVVEDLGGYKPSEMVGRSWAEFLHPDDHAAAVEDFRKNVSGDVEPREYRMLSKSGETHWLRSFGRPILEGDRIVGMRGVLTLITDHKRAEEALRESEERWRSLAENAPDIIMTVDADSTILFANRVVPGLAVENVIGTSLYDYLPPEHRDRQRTALGEVFETGEPQSYEIAGTGPGGRTSWYFSRVGPVVQGGKVVAAILITTDITEQRRAEEALAESEERYRTLVEAAPDAMVVHGDEKILFVNSAGVRLFGAASPGQIIGRPIWDFVHPENVKAVRRRMRSARSKRRKLNLVEEKLIRFDGRGIDVEMAAIPVAYEGKAARQVVLRDITERKRMEEALQRTREDLDRRVECRLQRGPAYGLTFRELTVLHLMADGKSDREIGTVLGISTLTAQKHVENIRGKMQAASRTEASVRAVREGLLG